MSPRPRRCQGCGIAFDEPKSGRRFCGQCSPRSRIEPVAKDRTASGPALLATRVTGVVAAWRAQDEAACRDELRQLADEARMLSRQSPLWPSGLEQRQRIAAESEGLGRIG
jgi:hypothetical protein